MNTFPGSLFCVKFYCSLVLRVVLSWCNGGMKCVCCGSQSFSMPLCSLCRKKMISLVRFPKKKCRICSKNLISEDDLCMECRESSILKSADAIFSLFSYRLWTKNLLFLWKMQGQRSLSPFFAYLANLKLMEISSIENSVIVPIPPRPGKIRKRSWDQIHDLALFLRYLYKWKIMSLLVRKSKSQQKKMDRNERILNGNKNYYLSSFCKKLIKMKKLPKSVIIIDDVLTTGVTAQSAASLLKGAGIESVKVLTLFIVD